MIRDIGEADMTSVDMANGEDDGMLSRRDRLDLRINRNWYGYKSLLQPDGKILGFDGQWRDDPRYDPDMEGPAATVTPIHGGTPDGRTTASASPTADHRTVHRSLRGNDDLTDEVRPKDAKHLESLRRVVRMDGNGNPLPEKYSQVAIEHFRSLGLVVDDGNILDEEG